MRNVNYTKDRPWQVRVGRSQFTSQARCCVAVAYQASVPIRCISWSHMIHVQRIVRCLDHGVWAGQGDTNILIMGTQRRPPHTHTQVRRDGERKKRERETKRKDNNRLGSLDIQTSSSWHHGFIRVCWLKFPKQELTTSAAYVWRKRYSLGKEETRTRSSPPAVAAAL